MFFVVLLFLANTTLLVAADAVDVCRDALVAWGFPSHGDVHTTIVLPHLAAPTSRHCTRRQEFYRAVNLTATECTLGLHRPSPGRVVDFTLAHRKDDGTTGKWFNSMACVPRHECVDEDIIADAVRQLTARPVYVRVKFMALWEDVDIDWIIVGLYKQGSTALARYMGLHPDLDLVWNTPNVCENNIFLDGSRLLPLQRQLDQFHHPVAPDVERRCRAGNKMYDGRHCLVRNSTRKDYGGPVPGDTSRGIKMFSPHPTLAMVDSILLNVQNRFLWTDVFPNLAVKIIIAVTDPVQCFYSTYYHLNGFRLTTDLTSPPISIHECITQVRGLSADPVRRWRAEDAVGSVENEHRWACSLAHNRCSASFVLNEGCSTSPLLCTSERLKVVRMGDLDAASYRRLVHWASKGTATRTFTPDIKTRHNLSVKTTGWTFRNGTRYPSSISFEDHVTLNASFASEYVDIESWVRTYAP